MPGHVQPEYLAKRILKDTCDKWHSLKGKYASWDSGFAVFYSPVREHPDLMIVGFNPGGDERAFDEGAAKLLPTDHEYFAEDYPLARRIRTLFEGIGKTALLKSSVKFNLIFFRTKNAAGLRSLEARLRRGRETFKRLRDLLGPAARAESAIRDASGRRCIYSRTNLADGVKLIGIAHPTGARVSSPDWARISTGPDHDLTSFVAEGR